MSIVFLALIIIASLLLGFFVLIQNPKGGGLSDTIAGFNNQFMGVKQTTDVLEKGTWILASTVAVLCLVSALFLSRPSESNNLIRDINTGAGVTKPVQQPAQQPATPAPAPTAPAQQPK